MFTKTQIDGMSKAEVKAALNLAAYLSEDVLKMLNDRMVALTAPPTPTPFPKQSELDDAYEQFKAWGATIKTLTAEARTGNHTFTNGDGATVKPTRTRKAPTGTAGKAQIVIGDNTYTSWQKAADGENVKPDLSRTVSRNWRPLVMAATAGTVKLTGISVEEYLAAFPIADGCKWTYEAAE